MQNSADMSSNNSTNTTVTDSQLLKMSTPSLSSFSDESEPELDHAVKPVDKLANQITRSVNMVLCALDALQFVIEHFNFETYQEKWNDPKLIFTMLAKQNQSVNKINAVKKQTVVMRAISEDFVSAVNSFYGTDTKTASVPFVQQSKPKPVKKGGSGKRTQDSEPDFLTLSLKKPKRSKKGECTSTAAHQDK